MSYRKVYFIGIGGIGMSALARYFAESGAAVSGYDRTRTPLTDSLVKEGITVHFEDNTSLIPAEFKNKASDTLVVYTPAVPKDHSELNWFLDNGFHVVKRSEILGEVARGKYVMAVSGTHGKTTTTTMLAYFNSVVAGGGSAFLGGISKNFDSNLVHGGGCRLAVEADEFDRSFLRLFPDVALVTSTDADHLDIYGDHAALKRAFSEFIGQIKPGGSVVIKKGVEVEVTNKYISVRHYSMDEPCDFYADNITLDPDGHYRFDIVCPDQVVRNCRLGIPGLINVENCIGAVALMWCAGDIDHDLLREAVDGFKGVKRRFDFYHTSAQRVYVDDYAHHPRELTAAITSIRKIYPHRRFTVIFQPHLYTRTRDFAAEFSVALSLADKVIMLPIYPARELPIEGVDSELIMSKITCETVLVPKDNLLEYLKNEKIDVLATFGAGDIDAFCEPIAELVRKTDE